MNGATILHDLAILGAIGGWAILMAVTRHRYLERQDPPSRLPLCHHCGIRPATFCGRLCDVCHDEALHSLGDHRSRDGERERQAANDWGEERR